MLKYFVFILTLLCACNPGLIGSGKRYHSDGGIYTNGDASGSSPTIDTTAGFQLINGLHVVVKVPVANIRNKQVQATAGSYEIDRIQETQVLMNDVLKVEQEDADWYKVRVLDQLISSDQGMMAYPGWIHKEFVSPISHTPIYKVRINAQLGVLSGVPHGVALYTLSIGTQLGFPQGSLNRSNGFIQVQLPDGVAGWISESDVSEIKGNNPISRRKVISRAEQFIGSKYLWGGFSAPMGSKYPRSSTGIDCSGLTSLVYRSLGVFIPRNADDQFRTGQRLSLKEVERGDLLFVSKTNDASGISHVMIFDSGDRYIESTTDGQGIVCWSTFTSKFGNNREQLDQRGGKVTSSKYVLAARVKGVSFVP